MYSRLPAEKEYPPGKIEREKEIKDAAFNLFEN